MNALSRTFDQAVRPDIPDNKTMMASLTSAELFDVYNMYFKQMQRAFTDNDMEKVVRIQTIMVSLGKELTARQTHPHDALPGAVTA